MNECDRDQPFLVYSRGLRPEILKLGSLCLDPANPVGDSQKIYQCPIKDAELSPWMSSSGDEIHCTLNLSASRGWLAGANCADISPQDTGEDSNVGVRLEGEQGRRVTIQRPGLFLEQVILPSAEAKRWLATQLTVSRTMHYLSRAILGTARHPRVWLVTGLQYISKARIEAGWSHSPHASTGIPGLTLDPTVAALTGLADASGQGPHVGIKAGGSTGDDTEKIWAAQFAELKMNFRPRDLATVRLPEEIQLRQFSPLGGMGFQGHEPVPSQEIATIEGLAGQHGDEEQDGGGAFPGMECEDCILYEELLEQVESRKGGR
ncbi:uncharacterized protein BO72DRAFT_485674 [Aspergillus fijiensis CBS 313.89]|uniref:Uncharacterized protein n=1 Tax=Aspergillus fijiensis CBS 313.89 TaxID=1448319 RepID=A0A8G1RQV7_9EURO|nr:uncharacterized protein BO72DRAFT_485674 [Aspergillus fijiensis CBS 313.89]RAK77810.1 hypothetical protein BO72DRAFT_485674 [Aspergillus fijiensis CBS 313.89]